MFGWTQLCYRYFEDFQFFLDDQVKVNSVIGFDLTCFFLKCLLVLLKISNLFIYEIFIFIFKFHVNFLILDNQRKR